MSLQVTPVRGGAALTAADWERCLTFHYLRSDGPLGGSTLTFLDATPAELALAAAEYGVTDETAQDTFVSQFTRFSVQNWLNGDFIPSPHDGDVPGYFRYLVLTALVSATEDGVGGNHNFRDRLGVLFGGEPLNSVSAVNDLWQALRGWCARRQAAGEPIRTIDLPSYGNMNLIGYAVRIAFPTWRDRQRFARVLDKIAPDIRAHPEQLAQELLRPHQFAQLPRAVAEVLRDFQRQLLTKRRMLLGHRFWVLVRSIDAQLRAKIEGRQAGSWTLEARFSGWEHDVLEFRLKHAPRNAAVATEFEGGLGSLLEQMSDLPTALARSFEEGILVFNQDPNASWVMDESRLRDDAPVLVMVHGVKAKRLEALALQSLGNDWFVSRKLSPADLRELGALLGRHRPSGLRLADLIIEGGVKIGRGAWLGRPSFLPVVTAASDSVLAIEPLAGTVGLPVTSDGPPWALSSPAAMTGRWRLVAREAGAETVKALVLEADAPERWAWPEPSQRRYEPEIELVSSARAPGRIGGSEDPSPEGDRRLGDLLEAIYAGAPADGWSEAELIPLLEPHMPAPYFAWDVVRALAEANWLDPWMALGWRARRWRLLPPTIVDASTFVRIEGALGAAALRRLRTAAEDLGGRLTTLRGLSDWTPPALVVSDTSATRLSEILGWQVAVPMTPEFPRAPLCWPEETRTTRGRNLVGLWSFEKGLFLPPEKIRETDSVRLERWVRERNDDRDVFRVTSGEDALTTTSRTAAIVEAHRQSGRPLFRWSRGGQLARVSRGGHLPLVVARALRCRTRTGSGPVPLKEGGWSYLYTADPDDAFWLADKFGAAIAGAPRLNRVDRVASAVTARRTGRQPAWYTPPPGAATS